MSDASPPADSGSTPLRLKGREIIVGVCGGIACYKVADLVSKLVQLGAGVTVVMTKEAQNFVTPLTFEALSGRKVRTDIWTLSDPGDTQPDIPPLYSPQNALEYHSANQQIFAFTCLGTVTISASVDGSSCAWRIRINALLDFSSREAPTTRVCDSVTGIDER